MWLTLLLFSIRESKADISCLCSPACNDANPNPNGINIAECGRIMGNIDMDIAGSTQTWKLSYLEGNLKLTGGTGVLNLPNLQSLDGNMQLSGFITVNAPQLTCLGSGKDNEALRVFAETSRGGAHPTLNIGTANKPVDLAGGLMLSQSGVSLDGAYIRSVDGDITLNQTKLDLGKDTRQTGMQTGVQTGLQQAGEALSFRTLDTLAGSLRILNTSCDAKKSSCRLVFPELRFLGSLAMQGSELQGIDMPSLRKLSPDRYEEALVLSSGEACLGSNKEIEMDGGCLQAGSYHCGGSDMIVHNLCDSRAEMRVASACYVKEAGAPMHHSRVGRGPIAGLALGVICLLLGASYVFRNMQKTQLRKALDQDMAEGDPEAGDYIAPLSSSEYFAKNGKGGACIVPGDEAGRPVTINDEEDEEGYGGSGEDHLLEEAGADFELLSAGESGGYMAGEEQYIQELSSKQPAEREMTQFKLALDKYLSSAQSFDTNEVEHDDEDGSAQHPEPTLSETTPLTEAQKDGDISSRELHTPARLAKDGDVSSSELHTPARLANDGDVSSRELHTPARLAKNNSRSHSSVDVDVPRGASLKFSPTSHDSG